MGNVKRRFFLPGAKYSQNKTKIKAVFKKYGLAWKGSMDYPQWKSDSMRVVAQFDRENGITKSATLTYHGDALSECCIELTALMDTLGGMYDDDVVQTTGKLNEKIEQEIEYELNQWDIFHRPDVEAMRRGRPSARQPPAPEVFIEMAVEDWKKKREIKRKELMEELG